LRCERLRLSARAVPDRDIVAGLEEALGHGETHAAHADPADLLVMLCHSNLLDAATRVRHYDSRPHASTAPRSRPKRAQLSSREISGITLWAGVPLHYPEPWSFGTERGRTQCMR